DDFARLRPALAHPTLEPFPADRRIVFMAGLVVFAADDECVVLLAAGGCSGNRSVEALYADVVIRVGCIPVERVRYRVARNDGGGKAGEILKDVKLSLVREAQSRAEVVLDVGYAVQPCDGSPADAVRGRELGVEHVLRVALSEEEKTVEPLEITIDLFRPDDL